MTKKQILALFAILVGITVTINYIVLHGSIEQLCMPQTRPLSADKVNTDFAWGTAIGYLNPSKNYT